MKTQNQEPCYFEILSWPILRKIFPACLGVWIIVLIGLLSFGYQYADETFLIFFFGAPTLGALWAASKYSTRFYKTFFESTSKERIYFENVKNVEYVQDEKIWFLKFTLGKELFYFLPIGYKKNEKVLQQAQELINAHRENRSPKILPQRNPKV